MVALNKDLKVHNFSDWCYFMHNHFLIILFLFGHLSEIKTEKNEIAKGSCTFCLAKWFNPLLHSHVHRTSQYLYLFFLFRDMMYWMCVCASIHLHFYPAFNAN